MKNKTVSSDGAQTPLNSVRYALIVEDDTSNASVMGFYLDELGFSHDLAQNGADALLKIEQKRYDVVLVDIKMADMDGFELARRIRMVEREKNLARHRLVAVTAHALVGDREACLAGDLDDYISKPIDFPWLAKKLNP